ncbi:MAG: acyltransferase family protein [Sphingomicrobium sp.]|nr:acyltransferase [Sphingomonadales bacterium]
MQALPKVGFRTDIQALRGIAVLVVVIYHSGLGILQAGYLGVDLFFVISGYLITGIIARSVAGENFSFAEFYTRRVRRLLPAAYTVLLATTFASALLLTSNQYRIYLVNLSAAVFFSANISLWSQIGYFAPNSAFNPLLHLWSLAIEEQYYLFVPLLLLILPRRAWLPSFALASVVSLVGCLYLATVKPSVAFFWLPPRAWELGVGSIAAMIAARPRARSMSSHLLVAAVPTILLVPICSIPGPAPGFGAVAICLSAAIVILARDVRADRSTLLRAVARVGDFSYALYLIHWPIFALARAPRLSDRIPPTISIALIFVSIGLAWLLYTFVEEPFRRSRLSGRRLVLTAVAASALVLAVAWLLNGLKPNADPRGDFARPVEGFDSGRCFEQDPSTYSGLCSQSDKPAILLWGDSFGAHLMPGLLATTQRPVAQATRGYCTPFSNTAVVGKPNEFDFTRRCLSFNKSVIDFIRRTPSIKVIILSGRYDHYMPADNAYAIKRVGETIVRAPLGLNAMLVAQRETVATLRHLGRRVVVVSPPPPIDFDAGQCWLRKAEHLPIVGVHAGCRLVVDNPARISNRYNEMLAGFERAADVPVIRMDPVLCRGGSCQIDAQGKPLFRDEGHLTEFGSLFVGRRLQLGQRAWLLAR